MDGLKDYIDSISGFTELSTSNQINYFAYFLYQDNNFDGFKPSDIKKCFDVLNLPPYSNIPKYIKEKSKKSKTHSPIFFIKKNKYYLTPQLISKIKSEIDGNLPKIEPTNNLYSSEILNGTRPYIEKISIQTLACYDYGLYDACNVMMRRLLETLIIETFERKGKVAEIKDSSDNFLYLKDLIDKLTNDNDINISRNSKQGLKELKYLGDLSAHNRRFLAKKTDIDNKKDSLRIVLEELIHIIDYNNWK